MRAGTGGSSSSSKGLWGDLAFNGELLEIVTEVKMMRDGVALDDIQAAIARSKELQKGGKRRMPVLGPLKDMADKLQGAAAPHVNGAWFAHPSGDSSLQFNLASRSAVSEADEKQKVYRSNTKARFYCAEGVEPLLLLWTWPETGEEAFHDKHPTKAYVWMRFRFVEDQQGGWVYGGVEVLKCIPKPASAPKAKAKRARAVKEAAVVEDGGAVEEAPKAKRARYSSAERVKNIIIVLSALESAEGGCMMLPDLREKFPDIVGPSHNSWLTYLRDKKHYVTNKERGRGQWSITEAGKAFLQANTVP
jgi:hypothetical protein